mgnify:CR=1 FL=1
MKFPQIICLLSAFFFFLQGAQSQPSHEAPAAEGAVKVMSFNVLRDRWAPEGAPDWGTRRAAVFATIETHRPAILGLQEETGGQLKDVLKNLPTYASPTDWSRSGGHLLVRKESWNVLEQGKISIPRRREVSWVLVESTTSGEKWLFYNAHFWHGSETERTTAAKAITEHIIESNLDNIPVVVMGDLNCTDDSSTLQYLYSEKDAMLTFTNSYTDVATNNPKWGTYHRFDGNQDGSRIDHILVNQNVRTIDSTILNEKEDGVWPSDHYPILATLKAQ